MTFRPDQIGDKGQRYEVRYAVAGMQLDEFKVVGWSNSRSGADQLVAAWQLRPSVHCVWVIDRQPHLESQPCAS